MLCKNFGDEYIFLDNWEDILGVIESVGLTTREDEYGNLLIKQTDGQYYDLAGSLFVLQSDGEILKVYGHAQNIPYLFIEYELLYDRENPVDYTITC